MPSAFRFLVICLGAMKRVADGIVTLSEVVNELSGPANEPTELTVAIGLVLTPDMAGKELDLVGWNLDLRSNSDELAPLPGFRERVFEIPRGKGPDTLAFSLTLPLPSPGIYGFYLFDRQGAFGPPGALLATYTFGVRKGDRL